MGLPVLTVESELAMRWHTILEENGLNVRLDQGEIEKQELIRRTFPIAKGKCQREGVPKWVKTPWVVANEAAEIGILETNRQDQCNGRVCLVFMPNASCKEVQLFSRVQDILLASGAIPGQSLGDKDDTPSRR